MERPRPGDTIAENYEVLKLLGLGGMGEVYLVEDLGLRCLRAIKLLKPLQGDAARFKREARIQNTLRHKHIVEVYTVVRDPRFGAGMVMAGVDLAVWLEDHKPSRELALDLFEDIVGAMAFAHEKEVPSGSQAGERPLGLRGPPLPRQGHGLWPGQEPAQPQRSDDPTRSGNGDLGLHGARADERGR